MNIEQKLQQIGLHEKESRALQFLLGNGESLPSFLAKQLGMNRTTTYDVLNSLDSKGLVTKIIKRGKFVYQAVPPKQWIRYWNKKEAMVKEQKESLTQIIPELEMIYGKSKYHPKVVFFEGLDGIQQAVLDSLNTISSEIIGYSAVSQVIKFLPPKFVAYYTNEKIKREIKSRFVLKHSQENKDLIDSYKIKFYKKDPEGEFTPHYKIYEGGKYDMKNEIMIYDNKVLIVNIVPPHYSATLIQDKDITEGQKAIFEIAWNSSRPI